MEVKKRQEASEDGGETQQASKVSLLPSLLTIRVQAIKAKTAVEKVEFTTRQLSVAEMIKEALNSIITNDVQSVPDPNFNVTTKTKGAHRDGAERAGIIAPSLALAMVIRCLC